MKKTSFNIHQRSKHRFLLIFTLLILMFLSSLPVTQKISTDYVDASLNRALASFAIAKGLNSVISVAQGTELAATPAGVGVNIAVGELLDPINDMIERFSWMMLAASVSLGIQKILLAVTATPIMKGLFIVLALLFTYFSFKRDTKASLTLRVLLIILILRFSMPLVALANNIFYESFQKETYTEASQSLNKAQTHAKALTTHEGKSETSFFGKIKELYEETAQTLNVKKKLEALKSNLEESFHHLLNLMILFIVQTMILPLLYLYLVIKMIKVAFKKELFGKRYLTYF